MSWWNNIYMRSFSLSNLFGASSNLSALLASFSEAEGRVGDALRTAWMLCPVCAITGTEDLCKRLGVTFLALWETASVNTTLWHRCRLVSHQVCKCDFKVRNSKTLGFHWFVLEGIGKIGFVLVYEATSLFKRAKFSSQRVIVKPCLESWMLVTALLSFHIWKLHVLPETETCLKKNFQS